MYGRQEYTHDRTPPRWAVEWLRRLFPDRRIAWNNRAGRWDIVKHFVRRGDCNLVWAKVGVVLDPDTGEPAGDITYRCMEAIEFKWWLQDPAHHRAWYNAQAAAEVEEDAQIAKEGDEERIELFRGYHPTHLKRRRHANPRLSALVQGLRR